MKSKHVLITGAAQGIGRGMLLDFLRRGARVSALDIDPEACEELLSVLPESASVKVIKCDVGDEGEVQKSVQTALSQFGDLDALINNAGIANPRYAELPNLKLEDWNRVLCSNLTGPMLMAKHTCASLAKKRGSIVNISSTRALQSEANSEPYAASKGGLLALTHAMAVSLGPDIRVNCILPGWIEISHLKKKSKRSEVRLREIDHSQHPAGRVGKEGDIASMAAFLISEEAGFITGQKFVVDGGMTRKMIYEE